MMTSMTNPDIDLELQKLLLMFKRRWKLGISIVVLSIILSTIAAIQKKPQYSAVAKLLFKNSRASNLTGVKQNLNDFESLETNANPIVSEIEVIKSIPIIKETIADLELTDPSGEALEPEVFLQKLETKPLAGSDVVVISYQSSDPHLALGVVDRLMENYIQNSQLISGENISAANKIINEQLPKAKARVVEKESALQQFQEKHQIFLVDEEAQANVGDIRNLSQQIQDVKSELEEAQVRTKELEGQVGMNSQQALAWNKLSHSPAIRQDIEELQATKSQLLKERDRYNDNHPAVISLQNQIAAFETSLQQRISTVAGSSSQLSLEDLYASERENLPQELTSALAESEIQTKKLATKLNNLENVRQTSQQKFAQVPQLLNEFNDLQLQLETAQSKYKFLLNQSQELSLLEQQNFDNVRIIESAQLYSSGVQSASLLIVGMGGFIGTILAISAMATIDITDKLVKSSAEIESIFGYKILGTIPSFKGIVEPMAVRKTLKTIRSKFSLVSHQPELVDSQLVVPDSSIATRAILPIVESFDPFSSQAFWMLQAKLESIQKDGSQKSFVVSSSVPQEGKSTITANLALTLSRLGQKILIIDGNFHHPSQLDLWSGKNSIGLSEVILDCQEIDLAIVPIADNLDLISTGVPYCNPLEIISSPRMRHLLQDLANHYHLILIDSPSLQKFPDALSWANLADGMILVSRLGTLNYQNAHECRELLEFAGVNVVGSIVNNSP